MSAPRHGHVWPHALPLAPLGPSRNEEEPLRIGRALRELCQYSELCHRRADARGLGACNGVASALRLAPLPARIGAAWSALLSRARAIRCNSCNCRASSLLNHQLGHQHALAHERLA